MKYLKTIISLVVLLFWITPAISCKSTESYNIGKKLPNEGEAISLNDQEIYNFKSYDPILELSVTTLNKSNEAYHIIAFKNGGKCFRLLLDYDEMTWGIKESTLTRV